MFNVVSVILPLLALLFIGESLKFDDVKLTVALEKGVKDTEQIPCWNHTRWGDGSENVYNLLHSPGMVECHDCPCELSCTTYTCDKNQKDRKMCDLCDLDKTRALANDHAESKFTPEQIEECGVKSKCAKHYFFSDRNLTKLYKTCGDCPKMFSDQTLKKFLALLSWLEGLKA